MFLLSEKLLKIPRKALVLVLGYGSFVGSFVFGFSMVEFQLHQTDLIVSNLSRPFSLVRYNL